ncbi:MAG: LCP family protein [Eubacteriales bacterium]|nr:LCP family protein [Eubacteriales bacterium]
MMMKKILFFAIAVFMLFSLAACAKTQEPIAEQTQESAEPEVRESGVSAEPEAAPEPIPDGIEHVNILLMGSSEADFSRGSGNTYALTHILITIDPKNRVMKFTTFPYNLVVDVETESGVETGQLQFLCGALGADGAVAALENNFGIDIDYWVLMNMSGVSDIVDALEGIEIDMQDLSVNEMASYVEHILGLAWEEVTQTGHQMLSGIQTAGYFFNTTYDNPTAEVEEMRFREHHSNILTAVIQSIKALGFTSDDLMTIAANVEENYTTDIPDEEWQAIADSAIYCIENDPQFLHVPEVIKISETSQWDILFDPESDAAAVQEFAGE